MADFTSLPARGVWIEIYAHLAEDAGECGRSPQGECGLKLRGEVMHG